jgi:MYXO-CTERM domain-containing protein
LAIYSAFSDYREDPQIMIQPSVKGRGARWLSACALSVLFVTSPAAANGRFPAAGQLVVDPGDPSHIVVRTTYGILTTRDAGASWDWICEQAVQWAGQYDPTLAITKDGTVIAGVYDHLGVSHGDTCSWSHAGGFDQKNVVDVSTEKKSPAASVALTSSALGANMFVTQYWSSPDNAASWTQAGVDLPSDFQALTIDVAPSNVKRVYVSGLYGVVASGAIERSANGGASFDRVDIPGSDVDHAPYIAAIDPDDDQRLYVRLSGSPGRLLESTDGGGTWTEIFKGAGLLKGFALSPDGKKLVVGGESDGVWRAPTSTMKFEKVSSVGVQCLTWSAVGIYACAGEFKDGFTLGFSSDEGATFTSIMHLACLRGPLACGASTEVGKTCPGAWPTTVELIDQTSCMQGVGGAGGAGGSTTNPATGAGSGGGSSGGGCGCHTGASDEAPWGMLVAGLSILGLRRRRRDSQAARYGAARSPISIQWTGPT